MSRGVGGPDDSGIAGNELKPGVQWEEAVVGGEDSSLGAPFRAMGMCPPLCPVHVGIREGVFHSREPQEAPPVSIGPCRPHSLYLMSPQSQGDTAGAPRLSAKLQIL